jgi:GAF domain-containing protein
MIKQIQAIVERELPLVSNLANVSAILATLPDINWCGFYLAEGQTLYLGPFQGEPACTKIAFGRGVCGTAAKTGKTVSVADVNTFEGHIACSAKSKSELVVPVLKGQEVVAVIDIDAPVLSRFDEKIQKEVEEIASFLAENVF